MWCFRQSFSAERKRVVCCFKFAQTAEPAFSVNTPGDVRIAVARVYSTPPPSPGFSSVLRWRDGSNIVWETGRVCQSCGRELLPKSSSQQKTGTLLHTAVARSTNDSTHMSRCVTSGDYEGVQGTGCYPDQVENSAVCVASLSLWSLALPRMVKNCLFLSKTDHSAGIVL